MEEPGETLLNGLENTDSERKNGFRPSREPLKSRGWSGLSTVFLKRLPCPLLGALIPNHHCCRLNSFPPFSLGCKTVWELHRLHSHKQRNFQQDVKGNKEITKQHIPHQMWEVVREGEGWHMDMESQRNCATVPAALPQLWL